MQNLGLGPTKAGAGPERAQTPGPGGPCRAVLGQPGQLAPAGAFRSFARPGPCAYELRTGNKQLRAGPIPIFHFFAGVEIHGVAAFDAHPAAVHQQPGQIRWQMRHQRFHEVAACDIVVAAMPQP